MILVIYESLVKGSLNKWVVKLCLLKLFNDVGRLILVELVYGRKF